MKNNFLDRLTETLTEAWEYFDRYADAEIIDGETIANKEMQLACLIGELLDELERMPEHA